MTKWTRRHFLSAAAAALGAAGLGLWPTPAMAEVRIEHFQRQPWFADTTFDLRQDLEAANAADKILALIWEQRGCHFCEQMHNEVFQREDIVELISKNFHVIQMDMHGKRRFIDFLGDDLEERELARHMLVRGSPTTVFLDEIGDEVFRMPGFGEAPVFKAVYRYVKEAGYEVATIQEWVKTHGLE